MTLTNIVDQAVQKMRILTGLLQNLRQISTVIVLLAKFNKVQNPSQNVGLGFSLVLGDEQPLEQLLENTAGLVGDVEKLDGIADGVGCGGLELCAEGLEFAGNCDG